MGRIILRWIIRPPTEDHQDNEDIEIDEDGLWKKIVVRLKNMGLIKDPGKLKLETYADEKERENDDGSN